MAYYLQMDGVDDYIRTPTMTFDEIVYDFVPKNITSPPAIFYYLGDSGGFYAHRKIDNTDTKNGYVYLYSTWSGGSASGYGWNTVVQDNIRQTYRVVMNADGSGTTNVRSNMTLTFCNNTNLGAGGFLKADFYSITVKLAGAIVAYYDMTLGEQVSGKVLDQSGNGHDATLTNGGTWVSDGGASPITHSASGAASGITSGSATVRKIKANSGTSQPAAQASATAYKIYAPQVTSQGASSISVGMNQTRTISASCSGSSVTNGTAVKVKPLSASVSGVCASSATCARVISGQSSGVSSITATPVRTRYVSGTVESVGWAFQWVPSDSENKRSDIAFRLLR